MLFTDSSRRTTWRGRKETLTIIWHSGSRIQHTLRRISSIQSVGLGEITLHPILFCSLATRVRCETRSSHRHSSRVFLSYRLMKPSMERRCEVQARQAQSICLSAKLSHDGKKPQRPAHRVTIPTIVASSRIGSLRGILGVWSSWPTMSPRCIRGVLLDPFTSGSALGSSFPKVIEPGRQAMSGVELSIQGRYELTSIVRVPICTSRSTRGLDRDVAVSPALL